MCISACLWNTYIPSYFRLSTIHWQLVLQAAYQVFLLLSKYETGIIVPLDSNYSLLLTVLVITIHWSHLTLFL